MSISAIGMQANAQSLFDTASSGQAAASGSAASGGAGSGSAIAVGEDIASALYGFDGRVLAMQANAVSELFSALA